MSITKIISKSPPQTATNASNYSDSVDTIAGTFAELLKSKINTFTETAKEMSQQQEELTSLKKDRAITEIIRRIMPDGSIMVTKYSNGRVESRYRKYPHMVVVPDDTSPIPHSSDGYPLTAQQTMVLKPSRSIAGELFS
ncbi:MAG: hypothetical protein K6C05_06845 [Anaerovibrio sp.]|uniref:hypothetical protein n=1 Tax=Anaerovibrio sp. TaxID=1872532 RepID=UPI0025FD71FF|nr:hypothetical protein [Anaerovibrio sp.]MCR5176556.1 hypothetical protein [Anaerovibrio sp.]